MMLIVSESVAAITTHLRDATEVGPNFGGHSPRPYSLCGVQVAWDTHLPIAAARCRACLAEKARAERELARLEESRAATERARALRKPVRRRRVQPQED